MSVATRDNKIQSFKIKELFEANDEYQIPIYQRNYAWQESQVVQLVQDIFDSAEQNKDKTYYIGTLVVFEKINNSKTIYETIDGQQRLTTLSILLNILQKHYFKDLQINHLLKYESRESSNKTFNIIYDGGNKFTNEHNYTMRNAYETLQKELKKMEQSKLETFKTYLLNNVEILRVCVPEDTDLNHYFEIMNNRGEQLEKHEVLKAQMMSGLVEKDRIAFSKIWEACSDMSRYVQYGFNPSDREAVFGKSWNSFLLEEFTNIINNNYNQENKELEEPQTIEYIILNNYSYPDDKNEKKSSERFTSPINFQNFLLHVLKIQKQDDDIPLDDKRLIEIFRPYFKEENFVKIFGFNLLKAKYLFDNYILKRDYSDSSKEDGEWSLKRLLKGTASAQYNNSFGDEQNDNPNKQLIMLLSMFHVSNPSQIYKHWLTGALNYLFQQDIADIKADEYIKYLEKQAELFLKNNYIATQPNSYQEIIFKDALQINHNIKIDKLNDGTNVENFIFNYLDYLLWKQDGNSKNKIFDTFHFTFRSSVEHFYPQNPIDGQDILDKTTLDCFGNLCLISASKNSKLTNLQPEGKKSHYRWFDGISPKQFLMMDKANNWNKNAIKDHQDAMISLLMTEQ
jgi:hypothetical protein